MHSTAPRPSGAGAVRWCASAVDPLPATSAYTVAPRATAALASSSTSTPPASAEQKPSRSTSKGREIPDDDSAFMFRKPLVITPVWHDSEPPTRTASHRPAATSRAPLLIACVPDAHAVTTVSTGPRQP